MAKKKSEAKKPTGKRRVFVAVTVVWPWENGTCTAQAPGYYNLPTDIIAAAKPWDVLELDADEKPIPYVPDPKKGKPVPPHKEGEPLPSPTITTKGKRD